MCGLKSRVCYNDFTFLFYMKMIEKFLDYTLYTRNLSETTVIKYKKGLKKFESYLQSIWKTAEKPEEISLDDIFCFIADMRRSGLQPQSCNAVLDGVRGYLKYLRDVLDLKVINQRKILYLKVPQYNVGFYNKEEKNQILKSVNKWVWVRYITQLRNKLLTYMLLNTWLRCHELAKIKVNEIWESLTVIGKWWKKRTVFLKRELLDMIYDYLSKRKRKSDYLFESTKAWNHLREGSIRKVFIKLTNNLWFHIHCHKFRHTFATDLLHLPWSNIYNVAKLLGHSKITTTHIYLWAEDLELKKLQFSLNY